MKRRDPRERSRAELAAALVRYGKERPRLEQRGEEPWPGDLYVLAETAGFPVEWLVVERGRQGDCLVVAADTNPALGSADVALPPEAEGGPLSVRCAVDLRIKVESLRQGERTGSVAADDLGRVRRRRAELAAGSPTEREPDPDYEDWLAEVVQPARAALSPAVAAEEPALPAGRRAGAAGKSVAIVAACILFLAVCGVAVLARRFQQGEQQAWQEVGRLRAESRQSEAEHRRELRSLEEEARRRLAAAAPRQPPAAPAPEAGRPLANLVYASLYPGESRGAVREIGMPPGTTYLFLALSVASQPLDPEYRVEVAKEQGAVIWSLDGLHPLPTQEVTVALPRAQIPDGAYRIRLFGLRGKERHELGQFHVRIISGRSAP